MPILKQAMYEDVRSFSVDFRTGEIICVLEDGSKISLPSPEEVTDESLLNGVLSIYNEVKIHQKDPSVTLEGKLNFAWE